MFETIFETASKVLITAACTSIIGGVGGYAVASWRTIKAIKNGVQCMLRNDILREHKEYTHKGYCPLYAKEALHRTYTAYHNLGGNDIATAKYKDVMNLPDYDPEKGA